MRRWEYNQITTSNPYDGAFLRHLDEAGSAGWEVVCPLGVQCGAGRAATFAVLLKREIETAPAGRETALDDDDRRGGLR